MFQTKHIAYKFKLRPTLEQRLALAQAAGCCRWIYNWGLQNRIAVYEAVKDLPKKERNAALNVSSNSSQELQVSILRSQFPFLKTAPYHALQSALTNLDIAYKKLFTGLAKYPCFKSKKDGDSFTEKDKQCFSYSSEYITIPKVGKVKYFNSRPVKGTPTSMTVTRKGNDWYVAIACKLANETKDVSLAEKPPVGIDVGIARSMTFSDRTHIQLPTITPTEEREHARLQRIVARKVKRSRRWWKAAERARKFSEHITNRVADTRHKETTKRAKNQGLIAVEDLSVQDMMGSASGTLAAPGKQVAQKRGLNRSLGRQGFGITFSQLEYKQGWQGQLFIKVPPAGTSQTCHKCKHKAPENRLSQEKFKCVKCGYESNADDNASDNIKDLGLEQARVRHLLSADGLSVVARGRLSELRETRTKTKTPKRWRKSRKRGIGACTQVCAPTGNEVV